jgi:3-phenylpropionate/cinnamic acid dioxygenase small subunit
MNVDPSTRYNIENTLNCYTLALDSRNLEGVLQTFTADASFSIRIAGGDLIGPHVGHKGIRELITESFETQLDQRRHICSNLVIREVGNGRARVEYYLTLISIDNGAIRLVSTGIYKDEMVEEDGVWRVSKRHLDLDLPF